MKKTSKYEAINLKNGVPVMTKRCVSKKVVFSINKQKSNFDQKSTGGLGAKVCVLQ